MKSCIFLCLIWFIHYDLRMYTYYDSCRMSQLSLRYFGVLLIRRDFPAFIHYVIQVVYWQPSHLSLSWAI